jgi:two-component system, OmpR family, KDP operon response regulator KdpE
MATVLVIDDDTALLAACRVGQRALGHQVRTAATGDAGLSDAAVYPPAVVVLDLGLPDIVCRSSINYGDGPKHP